VQQPWLMPGLEDRKETWLWVWLDVQGAYQQANNAHPAGNIHAGTGHGAFHGGFHH
jgi:hypothetical protein